LTRADELPLDELHADRPAGLHELDGELAPGPAGPEALDGPDSPSAQRRLELAQASAQIERIRRTIEVVERVRSRGEVPRDEAATSQVACAAEASKSDAMALLREENDRLLALNKKLVSILHGYVIDPCGPHASVPIPVEVDRITRWIEDQGEGASRAGFTTHEVATKALGIENPTRRDETLCGTWLRALGFVPFRPREGNARVRRYRQLETTGRQE